MRVNYYDILAVNRKASQKEIKKAYRFLAMKLHPDQNASPDANQRFLLVKQAYETLSDNYKRKHYDLYLDGIRTWQNTPVSTKSAYERAREQKIYQWQQAAARERAEARRREEAVLQRLQRIVKIFSAAMLGFYLIIGLDFIWAGETSLQVTRMRLIPDDVPMIFRTDYIVYSSDNSFKMDRQFDSCVKVGDRITLRKGRIFGIVSRVAVERICNYGFSFVPSQGLQGGPGWLVVFVVLVAIAILTLPGIDPLYVCLLGVLELMLFPVVIYILVQSI